MSIPPLTPEQSVKPPRFEARMSLAFAVIFISMGIHVPYFPVWLESVGFGPNEIGVILAAPMFLRVLTTPLFTTLADRAKDRANVLTAVIVVSALVSLGYFLPSTYVGVLTVSLVLAVFWTPHTPLTDSIALSGVRRFGCSYTGMRVWGSIFFLLANFGGGVILSMAGAGAIPVVLSAALFLSIAVSLLIPRLGPPRRPSMLSLDNLDTQKTRVFDRYFLLSVVGAGIIIGSHGFYYTFVSIYWQSIGYGDALIGLLWSGSVAAEVCIFWLFPRLFGGFSSTQVLLIAGLASVVRWVGFPVIEPLGLGIAGFFAVQALHAFSTALVLIGVQKLIGEYIPEHQTGSAQGVAFFANGTSLAAVTLLSGPLYAALGIDGFWPMVGVAALGMAILIAAGQPQRSGSGGETSDPR